jgi:IclR family transcriptional regulator, mhp operon transcriptional activator
MEKGVPIRSISRSISVLQAINRHGSLSMIAIARQSAVPYPTACRIVQTLIHEGLIEQEPARKRYRATALVQSLSHGFQHEGELVNAAADAIRALTREVGWPVSLAVRVGTRMVVRDSTHNQTSLTYERYYPGFTLPLLGCASGRLCLAHMAPEELDNVMRWLSLAGEDTSPIQLHAAVDTLQKIREQGYAAQGWGQYNLTPGKTSSIAVPIMREGRFEAALTLIYFAAAMKQPQAIERYLDTMKVCAAQIEVSLQDPALLN